MDKLSDALLTGSMDAVFDALPASHRWVVGAPRHEGVRLLSVAVVGRVVVTLTMDGWLSAHSCNPDSTDAEIVECAEGKVLVGIAAGGVVVTGPKITVASVQAEPSDAEISAELARLLGPIGW